MLLIVADKDPADLDALVSSLVSPDREVLTATDGGVVVNLATSREPDVVIVSASLGHMGGFAVSRELKTLASTGEIRESKVIVLLERASDAWLAAWSQCDAWLTKPIDPADVDELVRELVGTRL